MKKKGWTRRVLGCFFGERRRHIRSSCNCHFAFSRLEDRCLPTLHVIPADLWPIDRLVPGQVGDLWYGRLSGSVLGHVSAQGAVAQFNGPAGTPTDLQTDAYGNLWFRVDPADATSSLNRLTPAGSLTTLTNLGPVAARVSDLSTQPASFLPRLLFTADGVQELVGVSSTGTVSLVAAPATVDTTDLRDARGALPVVRAADGAFWYPDGNGVARLTVTGDFQRFALPPGNGNVVATVGVGGDGNVWFVEARSDPFTGAFYADKLGRLTLDGVLTEARLVSQGLGLRVSDFTTDAAGNLWFDQQSLYADGFTALPDSHRLGRIGSDGVVTYYAAPLDDGTPLTTGIGPDGKLWTNVPFAYDFVNQYTTPVDQVALSTLGQDGLLTITFPAPGPRTVVGRADAYTIQHGNTLSVASPGVLGNDFPGQAAPLTATLVTGPAHGTVTLNANGSFTYTPSAGYQGADSFVYQAGNGTTTSGPVTVTVEVANQAPVTPDAIFYGVLPGAALNVAAPGLLAGASDANGNPLTAVLSVGPAHGTLTLNTNGSFVYTPAAGFQGADSFTYRVSDGIAQSGTATVTVEVSSLPVAHGDTYSVSHERTLRVYGPGLLANDTKPSGPALTVTFVTAPAHGSLSANPDGSFLYTPAPGYVGPDSFTYQANSGASVSNTATVTLNVTNAAPVVPAGLTFTANQNEPLSVAGPALFAGASDADADLMWATVVTDPAHGLLVSDPDGSFVYTPAPGYVGPDSFTYQLSDGAAASAIVTVSITVSPHNSPPLVSLPVFATGTTRDVAFTAEVPVHDADSDTLVLTLTTAPAHGTVTFGVTGSPAVPTFTYTPAANYTGADSFTYQVSDGHGGTATGSVSVTVTPTPQFPQAGNLTASTNEDTPLTGTLPASGTGTLQVSRLYGPGHGILTVGPGAAYTYRPDPNYFGPDSFSYLVDNGTGSAAGTVAITVNSVNDVPVGGNRSLTTIGTNPVTTYLPVSDRDGDLLVATLTAGPAHGTVTFTNTGAPGAFGSVWFTFTPGAGFNGSDSFTYQVSDGHGGAATGTITLATPVQVPPVANNFSVSTFQGVPFVARFPAYDPNNDALAVTIVTGPSHGVAQLSNRGGLLFTYAPTAGYSGADSFTYRVDDGHGGTATATATITVNSTGGGSGGGGQQGGGEGSGPGGGAAVTIDPPRVAPPDQKVLAAPVAKNEIPATRALAVGTDTGTGGRTLAVALASGLSRAIGALGNERTYTSTLDVGNSGIPDSPAGRSARFETPPTPNGGRASPKVHPLPDSDIVDEGFTEWDLFDLMQFQLLVPGNLLGSGDSGDARQPLSAPHEVREYPADPGYKVPPSHESDTIWIDQPEVDFRWLGERAPIVGDSEFSVNGAGREQGTAEWSLDLSCTALQAALAFIASTTSTLPGTGQMREGNHRKGIGRRRAPLVSGIS